MAKSPEEMAASMIANLEAKTGKNLEAWLSIVRSTGLEKHGQIVKHLKTEFAVTHGYANLITAKAREGSAGVAAGDDLVGTQYAGPKEHLRPIFGAVIARIGSFGDDVEVAPKKTYVSLRRNKQFALIQPSTKTRVDVGINLKGTEPTSRLEISGSFNAMVSHRVRLSSVEEVDDELESWLRAAYDAG